MKKICFIYSNYDLSKITGQAGMMLRLEEKTCQAGFETYVISNSVEKVTDRNHTKFIVAGPGSISTYVKNFFIILFKLKSIRPDILCVHGSQFSIYITFIAQLLSIPVICVYSEVINQHHAIIQKIIALCVKKSSFIITTSNVIKDELCSLKVDAKKIHVIRIGLSDDFARFKITSREQYDILYFGDSKKERGFEEIYQLAKALPTRAFLILIRFNNFDCGTILDELRTMKNVTILTYPYKENFKTLIMSSRLVVLPFRWMSVRPPISLLESMALAKCTITSQLEGNLEIIRHGKNGYAFNFKNMQDVIKKIQFLLEHQAERNKIGLTAKKDIMNIYSSREYNKFNTLIKSV